MDHISTGKDWDLARRSGGIKILPPFITAFGNSGARSLYKTRLEAIVGISEFILHCKEDVVVFSDCDTVCNIDISSVIKAHEDNKAIVTFVTAKPTSNYQTVIYDSYYAKSDEDGRIKELSLCTTQEKDEDIITNVTVIDRLYLLSLINEALSHGYTDIYRDILSSEVKIKKMFSYRIDSEILRVSSLQGYYSASMALLDEQVRKTLINVKQRPVFTKVRNSAPTIYKDGASIKNSYIADGCEIEGCVENSIIFRGVKISKESKVKNSIVLQNSFIGEASELNCVITDKDVTIKGARVLSGDASMPFYVIKGAIV